MDLTVKLVLAGVTAFAAAAALIPLILRVAHELGVVDEPKPDRVHDTPTPYMGGVAIVIAACAAGPFLHSWRPEATYVLGAAVALGAIGLIDDVRTVTPRVRLLLEVAAALVAAASGAHVRLVDGPVDWAITVVWLVGVTNAYNLLDNMDGAAGVIATVTAVAMAVAAGLEGQVLVGGLAAVLGGASLGFLLYNWHPARIFMGDAGSLFLGYLLGVIALELRFPVPHTSSISAVLLLTGPAVFDTTLVVLSRWRAGRPVYVGGVDHTTHRLLRRGMGPIRVALLAGAAAATCCGLGVAVGRGAVPALPVIGAVGVLGVVLIVLLLRLDAVVIVATPTLAPSAET